MLLKNFLQLVLLLDRTMSDPEVKLPRGAPPLFSPTARLKSSKHVCAYACVCMCTHANMRVRACVCVGKCAARPYCFFNPMFVSAVA